MKQILKYEFNNAFPYLEEIYNDSSKESKGRNKIKYWEKTVSKYYVVKDWLENAKKYWIDFKEEGKQYKENVLKLNDYSCSCCRITPNKDNNFIKLSIHLKENPVFNKEIRYDLNNAYVLCSNCEKNKP